MMNMTQWPFREREDAQGHEEDEVQEPEAEPCSRADGEWRHIARRVSHGEEEGRTGEF